MESDWANERLDEIKLLMERSAIYRRALAPVMIFLGVLGMAAAAAGLGLGLHSPKVFPLYWLGVGGVGMVGTYVMTRRQAFQAGENFWSPPTRRVTQALLPPFVAGGLAGVLAAAQGGAMPGWIPALWLGLYGCGAHAAGFFMPRGMKLLGWLFVVASAGLGAAFIFQGVTPEPKSGHWIMGLFFGLLHLLYGLYLRASESRMERL